MTQSIQRKVGPEAGFGAYIHRLNKGRGGKERALRGKQVMFRMDKWALRRIDGRLDSFVTMSAHL